MACRSTALLLALAHAAGVAAHGHVSNVVINGVYYENYDPTSFPYMTDPPIVAGWTAGDTDNGFIAPDAFNTSDIICHKNATNAGGHIGVAAGTYISIQWTPAWPESHHGPVIDYLANCNGLCEEVNKNDLQFFKIDGAGWISGGDPGVWATDTLEADNSTWLVQIPVDIAPGNYVLRHEIIALHAAESLDGAQAYPQCINLAISGTGTYQPSGTYGTALYHETDPGILYDIYTSPLPSYTVPGPTLISGVSSSCSQSSSTATATSSCTIPGSSASSTTATTTAAGSTTKSTTSSTVKSTTTTAGATTKTTTTTTTTTSAPAGTGSAQTLYGQCGGSGWTGATSCVAGATCSTLNAYYAQCVSA